MASKKQIEKKIAAIHSAFGRASDVLDSLIPLIQPYYEGEIQGLTYVSAGEIIVHYEGCSDPKGEMIFIKDILK